MLEMFEVYEVILIIVAYHVVEAFIESFLSRR
jgi:hypothetical protein